MAVHLSERNYTCIRIVLGLWLFCAQLKVYCGIWMVLGCSWCIWWHWLGARWNWLFDAGSKTIMKTYQNSMNLSTFLPNLDQSILRANGEGSICGSGVLFVHLGALVRSSIKMNVWSWFKSYHENITELHDSERFSSQSGSVHFESSWWRAGLLAMKQN